MSETNEPLYCTQCGKNIPGSSQFCDQCGTPVRPIVQQPAQPQAARSSKAVQIAVVAVVAFLFCCLALFALVQWSAQGGATNNASNDPAYCKNFPFDDKCPNHEQYKSPGVAHQPDKLRPDGDSTLGCLQMVRKKGEVDESFTYVSGTVKNTCGRDFSYVEVSFKLIDHDGNVVGTAVANQTNLKDGETWKFQAMGTPAAHHDRFEGVSAY